MSFLEKGYKVPQDKGNYYKFKQGDNQFRVVSDAIVGFEYWNMEGKPVRLVENPVEMPKDIRLESDNSYKIKPFMAFKVLDREDKAIRILQLTQKGIMETLTALFNNPKWGDLQDYDVIVNRVGEGLETKYSTTPDPKEELTAEEKSLVARTQIDLGKLFAGGNPFSKEPEEDLQVPF